MHARRIVRGEGRQLRALRLEALHNEPMAYLETYASALLLDDAKWEERAARSAEGDARATYVVEGEDGAWIGMAGVRFEEIAPVVVAVYIVPAARGTGVLEALLGAICEWASARGHARITLWVHRENPRARRAYARLGFVETGAVELYPLPPGGEELEMTRALPRRA